MPFGRTGGCCLVGGLVLGVGSSHHLTQDKHAPDEQLVAFSIRHGTVTARTTNPLVARYPATLSSANLWPDGTPAVTSSC
jgi:hypothetical protein